MPIVAADIIAYGSASMPDDDTPTGIGGAIDTAVKVVFTDISATDTVEILTAETLLASLSAKPRHWPALPRKPPQPPSSAF